MFIAGDQHGAYGTQVFESDGGGYPFGKGVLLDAHTCRSGREGRCAI